MNLNNTYKNHVRSVKNYNIAKWSELTFKVKELAILEMIKIEKLILTKLK
jgi:hypothetical protein